MNCIVFLISGFLLGAIAHIGWVDEKIKKGYFKYHDIKYLISKGKDDIKNS